MEELEFYLEELEDSYDEFLTVYTKTVNYARELGFEYNGFFDAENLLESGTLEGEIEDKFNSALENAQELSNEVENQISRLSKEMKIYKEHTEILPETYHQIQERKEEIRDDREEMDKDLEEIRVELA